MVVVFTRKTLKKFLFSVNPVIAYSANFNFVCTFSEVMSRVSIEGVDAFIDKFMEKRSTLFIGDFRLRFDEVMEVSIKVFLERLRFGYFITLSFGIFRGRARSLSHNFIYLS